MLNFSVAGNQLEGAIPESFTNLSSLLSLDLTANHLSSTIPPLLGSISSLADLGLVGNQFSGPIPAQWASFPESSFVPGNPLLCGAPLRTCPAGKTTSVSSTRKLL